MIINCVMCNGPIQLEKDSYEERSVLKGYWCWSCVEEEAARAVKETIKKEREDHLKSGSTSNCGCEQAILNFANKNLSKRIEELKKRK